MARTFYGGSPADVIAQVSSDPTTLDPSHKDFGPLVTSLTAWDSATAGTQLTDLQTSGGSAATVVTPDALGRVMFYGPDGYTAAIWLEDASGTRWRINPSDLATRTGGVSSVSLNGGTPQTGVVSLTTPAWGSISGQPAVIAAGATAAAAWSAISSGALGTTATTAKAGDYQPTAANISDATAAGRALLKAADAPTALSAIGGQAQADFPVAMSSLVDGDVATWDDQAQVWSNQQPQQVALPNYLIQGVILNPGQPVPSDFPDGAIAFVRATAPVLGMVPLGKNGSVTTTATVTVNITDAVAVGDNIFVNIGCTPPSSGVTSTITVTDAGSNTFTNRGAVARGTVIQGQVFSARATTALASGAAVTVTLSAAVGDVEVEVSKMTGLASPSFDQSGQASGGGVTSLNVTTNATTAANELATLTVAWNTGTINDPSTWTNGTGWTQVGLTQTSGGSFPKNVATFVKNLTAIGAVSVTPTISASGTMVALLATYKAA